MSITILRTRPLRLGAIVALAALLAAALFAVAGADNGLVTCDGPAYSTKNNCTYADGTRVQDHEINSGQWYRFNYAGEVYFGQPDLWADKVTDRNSNPVLSDAPAPAVLPTLSNGQLNNHGVYEGDTRFGRLNNAPKGPLVYQARGDYVDGGALVYTTDDGNHRVVRANDGQYHREELVRGQWVRSVGYGTSQTGVGNQAHNNDRRNAIWNAYYRSMDKGLGNPPFNYWSATLPDGDVHD